MTEIKRLNVIYMYIISSTVYKKIPSPMKVFLYEGWPPFSTGPEGGILVVLYYLSASEIWSLVRGAL